MGEMLINCRKKKFVISVKSIVCLCVLGGGNQQNNLLITQENVPALSMHFITIWQTS